MILSGVLEQYMKSQEKIPWMIEAAETNLPIVVPGWEDSTQVISSQASCIKEI